MGLRTEIEQRPDAGWSRVSRGCATNETDEMIKALASHLGGDLSATFVRRAFNGSEGLIREVARQHSSQPVEIPTWSEGLWSSLCSTSRASAPGYRATSTGR